MTEVICKILEKRYDADSKVPGDKDGWVLVDIIPGSEFEADNEEFPHLMRGEIFGWTHRERIDEELQRTGFSIQGPLMECGDQHLIDFTSRYVIPIEWQRDFATNPEMQGRLFVCVKK